MIISVFDFNKTLRGQHLSSVDAFIYFGKAADGRNYIYMMNRINQTRHSSEITGGSLGLPPLTRYLKDTSGTCFCIEVESAGIAVRSGQKDKK